MLVWRIPLWDLGICSLGRESELVDRNGAESIVEETAYMRMILCRRGALPTLAILLLGASCGSSPASQASAGGSGGSNETGVVARVGDRTITLAEVDERALQSNMKAFQELYDARREAIEELVADALLQQEAGSRGISKDDLVAAEIDAKVPEVTQQDVEAFYNQNRARLGGQTLEQIGPQIHAFLVAQNESVARQTFLASLRSKTTVAISLDPPRVPIRVADNERVKGPENAPVTIVEYSDFQ